MSKRVRIIPVLSIIEGQLVKTVGFKNPKYLGDPINAIKILNDKEVDEIVLVDIRASQKNSPINYTLLKEMAGECFMPLAYGGGVNSFSQTEKIFSLGVEKIILNSALESNPELISEVASVYGQQSVVAALDFKKNIFGKYKLYFKSGSTTCKNNYLEYIKQLIDRGVGELIVTDISKEGTFSGYNNELLSIISEAVNVPVVANGGCSGLKNMLDVCKNAGCSAASAGSLFVYRNNDPRSILINYPTEEFKKKTIFEKF